MRQWCIVIRPSPFERRRRTNYFVRREPPEVDLRDIDIQERGESGDDPLRLQKILGHASYKTNAAGLAL